MLSISLEPGEYITIGDSAVVMVSRLLRGRCFLAIEADRSIPIVRSAVLERNGTPPPSCVVKLPPRKRPKYKHDAVFQWNNDRERAARIIQKAADHLEESGDGDTAKLLRAQLEQLVPQTWEEELFRK